MVSLAGISVGAAVPSDPLNFAITVEELKAHLGYVASEEMEGRAPGSEGSRKTSEYLIQHVQRLGLKPLGPEGYRQSFTIDRFGGAGPRMKCVVTDGATASSWKVNHEYQPFMFSASKGAVGPVVFVGYGISAPEYRYDDYEGVNVKGKIVVMFRHEPQEQDPKSPFKGVETTNHALFTEKVARAEKAGASAVIIVNDPVHGEDDEFVGITSGGAHAVIPVIQAKRASIEPWFQSRGGSLQSLCDQINASLKPASRELPGLTVDVEVELVRTQVSAHNVAAYLEGSDPALKDQVIIVGAHRDHLGKGEFGAYLDKDGKGKIHYGADDNGSGTVALMEIAEALALAPRKPKRSLLFIWFDGEESGLLGSRHYVEHPLVPLDRTVAMINMDMIGRSPDHRVSVTGFGSSPAFEGLAESMQQAFPQLVLDTGKFPAPAASDQMSFYQKGIPALFMYTGMHEDYHRAGDTLEKIRFDDLAQISALGRSLTEAVASMETRPVFTRVKQAFLGILPDPNGAQGVLIAQVTPHSPAEQAGLKVADIITSVDGKATPSFQDFLALMANRQPGEKIALKVHRGAHTMDIEARLGERPERPHP